MHGISPTQGSYINHQGEFTGQRQNPVLRWGPNSTCEGKHITMAEARDYLGFKSEVIWKESLYFNACRIEAWLQKHFHSDLNLGHRLWRVCGAGGTKFYLDLDMKPGRVVKLFITWCDDLEPLLANGTLQLEVRTRADSALLELLFDPDQEDPLW